MFELDKKTKLFLLTSVCLVGLICFLVYQVYFINPQKKLKLEITQKEISKDVGDVYENDDFILETEVNMPNTEVESVEKKEIESFSNGKLTSLDEAFQLLNKDDK
jgi:hypothetical protein